FRIGVHLGEILAKDGDIFGDGVNIAARLEGLSETGGIVVSETVHLQVRKRGTVAFEDLGTRSLKNITEPGRRFGATPARPITGSQSAEPQRPNLPDRPSIAVLPFANMSGEAEQQYFSDGITEDIITELSRFRQLFVIARNSSFQYRGQNVDVKRIAREL